MKDCLNSPHVIFKCFIPNFNCFFNHKGAVKSYILTITPQRLTVRPYQPVEFECFAASEDGQPAPFTPRFRVIDSRISFETTRVSENRVRFVLQRGLGPDQNGTIVECLSDVRLKYPKYLYIIILFIYIYLILY